MEPDDGHVPSASLSADVTLLEPTTATYSIDRLRCAERLLIIDQR
jgi:hypothetical protein